jgi:hypothetical protein
LSTPADFRSRAEITGAKAFRLHERSLVVACPACAKRDTHGEHSVIANAAREKNLRVRAESSPLRAVRPSNQLRVK